MEKTLMLEKTEDKRRRRQHEMDIITDSMDMSLSRWQKLVKDMEAWCATVHGATKSQTPFSN